MFGSAYWWEGEMTHENKSPESSLKTIKDKKVGMVDLRFNDIPGLWQHFSVPPRTFDHDAIVDGGLRRFLNPRLPGDPGKRHAGRAGPGHGVLDPFSEVPTLVVICTIRDPVTGESYSRDARHIAQKAEAYLKGTGVGDTAYFGPEPEHFVFDGVRYDQGTNYGFYEIRSHEANWDAGEGNGPSLGHKLRPKEGYFPVPRPTRSRMRAPKSRYSLKSSALRLKPTTMKWRPAARARSICASPRSPAWPTM